MGRKKQSGTDETPELRIAALDARLTAVERVLLYASPGLISSAREFEKWVRAGTQARRRARQLAVDEMEDES